MPYLTKNPVKLFVKYCLLMVSVTAQITYAGNGYVVNEVSEGVFFHEGIHEDATETNQGKIANVGFIIGNDCIAVIDTGGSYLEGKSLLAAIRKQSDLPICYVINTHVHPDHVLGNAVFGNPQTTFVGSAKLPAAIAARGNFYETRFKEILGDVYGNAEFIAPTQLVNVGVSQIIDLGERKLTLIAFPTAHTDNDLVVLDNNTKTMWTGDLLFVERIPALDGSINGWLDAIEELKGMDITTVIPGHGPVLHQDWKAALETEKDYFILIRQQVREIINDMGTINQATENVGVSEKNKWLMFDEYHKRNITSAFTELEWE
ncbi:quinoprotein relay system zinc metallohydrolase 2 [Methylophaga sp. OBS4]|uniref:quinoprotein relay system zinc metallohydrolase 2 n=1 Tax=Methylophaga sp. OBS4 TaxID=2991935 RepID=UPI0022591E5C|nr:quinoprotein relay system zinc metallohydrolase 2 [Methylophaga sp. OBS4]MCX4187731.1 quinoprotein relay system zinc metallohydrolase 2 [Methylophaga sp. OBS4]MCX4187750.1 quinoprotein relay system zinc metallohydrolase 2 [Methylophaga sp. OBS4]